LILYIFSGKVNYELISEFENTIIHSKRWLNFSDIDVAISGASVYILDAMKELEEATGRLKKGKKVYGD